MDDIEMRVADALIKAQEKEISALKIQNNELMEFVKRIYIKHKGFRGPQGIMADRAKALLEKYAENRVVPVPKPERKVIRHCQSVYCVSGDKCECTCLDCHAIKNF